jgi:ribosome recycling factor
LEKSRQASEDAVRKATDQIQDLTNQMIKGLDDLLGKKEKEIMEF